MKGFVKDDPGGLLALAYLPAGLGDLPVGPPAVVPVSLRRRLGHQDHDVAPLIGPPVLHVLRSVPFTPSPALLPGRRAFLDLLDQLVGELLPVFLRRFPRGAAARRGHQSSSPGSPARARATSPASSSGVIIPGTYTQPYFSRQRRRRLEHRVFPHHRRSHFLVRPHHGDCFALHVPSSLFKNPVPGAPARQRQEQPTPSRRARQRPPARSIARLRPPAGYRP